MMCVCMRERERCVEKKSKCTSKYKGERKRKILGVIYNVAAVLLPSPWVCGSTAVCVALRETPDKDRAGIAADALAGEIHLVTQHAK